MEQTTNYQLSQWEGEDRILREDFNADNAKVDAALKAEAEARAAADTAEAAARAALAAQVAKLGNCKVWTSSYVGTGTGGKDNPTTFTFPKPPVLALVDHGSGRPTWLVPGSNWVATDNMLCHLSWNGRTVSWYPNSGTDAAAQLNARNATYRVIALFAMDD